MPMKENSKKKFGKLQTAVLVRTVIPILVMGIIVVFYVSSRYEKMVYEQMQPMLTSVAISVRTIYDELYEGDYVLREEIVGEEKYVSLYKGEHELTGDYSIIDRIKRESDVEITLFYLNTRILTTLKDSSGERYIETGVHAATYNNMEKNPNVMFYNVDIDGRDYYVCYVPIFNSDGSLIGMAATAKETGQITKAVMNASIPIWVITLICILIAGYISVDYTRGLLGGIGQIRGFLQGMTRGELSNSLNSSILKREDEIGDTGRSVVAMQKTIRILVERDPLTSLYNRRYGTAKLKNTGRRAERNGMPFSIALGDIDFFKIINDTYGHEAGDRVLVHLSDQLRRWVAGKGFVTRWGGEEFLIVLEKCDQRMAVEELEKILSMVRNMEIPYQGNTIKIHMTFGVVDGRMSEDYEELVRQADARLYYGKEHGRNRVVADISEATDESMVLMDLSDIKADLSAMSQDMENAEEKLFEIKDTSKVEKLIEDEAEQNQEIEEIGEIVRKMADQLIMEEVGEDEPDASVDSGKSEGSENSDRIEKKGEMAETDNAEKSVSAVDAEDAADLDRSEDPDKKADN